jgi:hypothetical protein
VAGTAWGSYSNYSDSAGDTGETLTLFQDGTLSFSSGCTGLWVQQKKTIALEIDSSSCEGTKWVFVGTVKGSRTFTLSGTGTDYISGTASFMWSATGFGRF